MAIELCAVIPVFRHEGTVPRIVRELAERRLPVFLIDDGNAPEARSKLRGIAGEFPNVRLVSYKENGGKGKAVCAGLREAFAAGFSHSLQVDADGQHDLGELSKFIGEVESHPEDFVGAFPQYDESVPKGRLAGRKVTNFWVAVETLSLKIPDAMCGLRIYPLACTVPVLKGVRSFRMGFDIEILVRLSWAGVKMRFLPVRVFYPEGSLSNFRMLRDNVEISLMHARLTCSMIPRLPQILRKRISHG